MSTHVAVDAGYAARTSTVEAPVAASEIEHPARKRAGEVADEHALTLTRGAAADRPREVLGRLVGVDPRVRHGASLRRGIRRHGATASAVMKPVGL